MQLGFVIDHSRCIGCHACTVACKAENDVPLGAFRTWVKYVEEGTFPTVRRSFAVLRCNQCTDAPCVTICPTSALSKRGDGIVDVEPSHCIGCKACMQGCPYDALYINEDRGTAEKCHFCAHRTDIGLAPACAVVCPTEAIVPGDLHDPGSRVSRLRAEGGLAARRVEAGTGPNVYYREASEAALDPQEASLAHGSIWTDELPAGQVEAHVWEDVESRARARTVLDVPRRALWGRKITGYLLAKSVAAGMGLAGAALLPPFARVHAAWAPVLVPILGLITLALTSALLVADLKRPERFLKILIRPNWSSWLAKGSFVLAAYGLALAAWLGSWLAWWTPQGRAGWVLWCATVVLAALSAGYTGWLFGQAKGRPLWMRRGLSLHLVAQALVAGAATLLLLGPVIGPWLVSTDDPLATAGQPARVLRVLLAGGLGLHLLFMATEGLAAPRRRAREYARAHALLVRGPLGRAHWLHGVMLGALVPGALLAWPGPSPWPWMLAGALALVGLWFEDDGLVRAGQALPIS